MKAYYPLLLATVLFGPVIAQTTPPVVVVKEETLRTTPDGRVTSSETTVVEAVTPAVPPRRHLDMEMARRQLSIFPKAIPVPEPNPIPGISLRTYNSDRNVVVVEGRELPYVTLPVLFVKDTAELLDVDSSVALEDTARAIRELLHANPNAVFDIEGHTSTDGEPEINMELSAQRARKVYDELTRHYMIPATALSAHGYGENFPLYPQGNEAQMMLDRRVLVVRIK